MCYSWQPLDMAVLSPSYNDIASRQLDLMWTEHWNILQMLLEPGSMTLRYLAIQAYLPKPRVRSRWPRTWLPWYHYPGQSHPSEDHQVRSPPQCDYWSFFCSYPGIELSTSGIQTTAVIMKFPTEKRSLVSGGDGNRYCLQLARTPIRGDI